MKLQIRKLLSAALFALVATSTPAHSQDFGWYAGFGLGQSNYDECAPLSGNCDDSDTSLKIFGGYQFNTNWGLEAGYVDHGKVSAGAASVEVSGFEILGVGTLPINPQFSLFGKLGFFNWDADLSTPGGSFSDSGTDLTIGVGVQYRFTKNLIGRAEWQRYDEVDIDVLGISLVFKF